MKFQVYCNEPDECVDCNDDGKIICRLNKQLAGKEMLASEALYGFCGWLTTREEKTVMSSTDNCVPIVELIKQFCDENKLTEPREGWEDNLTHPKGPL